MTFSAISDYCSGDKATCHEQLQRLILFFLFMIRSTLHCAKTSSIDYVYITWTKWSLWDMNLSLGCTQSIFMVTLLKSAAAVVALDSDIPLL